MAGSVIDAQKPLTGTTRRLCCCRAVHFAVVAEWHNFGCAGDALRAGIWWLLWTTMWRNQGILPMLSFDALADPYSYSCYAALQLGTLVKAAGRHASSWWRTR